MYRCRRFLAILLSLALVASAFIFNVSAEETEFNQFWIKLNGNEYAINEGMGMYIFINAGSSGTLTIDSIRAGQGVHSEMGLTTNFILRAYVFYDTGVVTDASITANNFTAVSSDRYSVRLVRFQDYDRNYVVNQLNKSKFGVDISYAAITNSAFTINKTLTFNNTSGQNISLYFIFENVNISYGSNWFYYYFLRPAITTINDHLTAIQNYVHDIHTEFLTTQYSYDTITFDGRDATVTQNNSGSWLEAIHGILSSLLAPVSEQVIEEQKAKDAGAYDALDDAFDNAGSSFGSLSDFGSIGQIANWDSDAYNDDVEDHIIGWFSNTTKNNIDNVQINREDLHIVDFYSSNLEEILEVIGNGSAD